MLRVRMLGGISVHRGDRPLTGPGTQPRRLAILALIARAGERGITREKLLNLLWPDTEEDSGRRALTQALYAIRRDVGEEEIFVGVQDLRLNTELAQTDVGEFERAAAAQDYERAVMTYGGPFLDGFRVAGAAEFDRWVDEQRSGLTHRYSEVVENLARSSWNAGNTTAAVKWWRRLAAGDPLNARIAAELMKVLAATGDRAGALQHARIYEALVAQDLDLPPDRQVVRLAEQIRRDTASTPPPEISAPASDDSNSAEAPAALPTAPERPQSLPDRSAGSERHHGRLRPKRMIVAAIAAVAMAAVATGAVTLGSRPRAAMHLSDPYRVTADDGLALDPAISPDGRHIAYVAAMGGVMRIYVRQRHESRAILVSQGVTGEHRRPRWSPDGVNLLFQADRGIWMVPALGGTPQAVVERPADPLPEALYPEWSADGTELTWIRSDSIQVRKVDGGPVRTLAVIRQAHSPAWSPDGRWIAVVSGNEMFVYGSTTSALGNLAPSSLWLVRSRCGTRERCAPIALTGQDESNVSPAWLRNGAQLMFVSSRGGARDLFVVRLGRDGRPSTNPSRLTTGLGIHTASVSRDGRYVAYSALRQSSNVWSVPLATGMTLADARAVTSGHQSIEGVALSPDGRWLAFDSNRSGQQDIYKLDLQGGEPERVVGTPVHDFHPSWSADGKWIAFYSFRDGLRRAAIVPVRGGSLRWVDSEPRTEEEHSPVWSPDGRSLVFFRNVTGQGNELFETRRLADSSWSPARRLTFRGGNWPSFSADGRLMAYTRHGGLYLMDSTRDESHRRTLLPPLAEQPDDEQRLDVISARLIPDGSSVIVKARDSRSLGFWSIPASGGPPRLLLRLEDPQRPSPRAEFATDGRRLFFTLAGYESEIWAAQVDGR